ncbi:hypothetical protein CASFOL_032616 [Castilleja foliolosa]|uniref:Dirigent protein n=1 Tax=Castilleja foliolosa TaxID=1961234 RepID=A0ABD3C4L6_9LAMI
MATITNIFTILLLIISSSFIPLISPHQFSSQRSKNNFGFGPRPTMTNLQFYFYDKPSLPKATAIPIVTTPGFGFGTVVMIDDALLKTANKKSKVIGRAQGFYAMADQNTIGLLMVVNYVFTVGKYNGSSLSVLGRNPVVQPVRELPILGGTGLFRLARGYALASTKWLNLTTGDAIVEYNVTVLHYENDD